MVPLFPYLVVRHGVGDVPTTIVNGRPALVGPKAEADYLRAIVEAVDATAASR